MAGCLYIHVPFCQRKCAYCDFLSVPFEEGLARGYKDALVKETYLRAGGSLETVYMGGGTPTVLPDEALEEIFSALRECFDFGPGMEITLEANPGTLSSRKAAILSALGANRLSLGVQSFNDGELRTLGRVHIAREAERAAMEAREAGFDNLSMDLIYGIPGQSVLTWKETLRRAVSLGPRHISAYELTLEPGTPIFHRLQRGELRQPGEEESLEMARLAEEALSDAGFVRYEISNYALPGFECRHNINYWHRGEYMGLGPGAHSFTAERRERNTGNIARYVSELGAGRLPVEESAGVSRGEAIEEALFLGLRLTRGIDALMFGEAWGIDLSQASAGLIEEGLVEIEAGRIRLTKRGLLLFNPVLVRLMEGLCL